MSSKISKYEDIANDSINDEYHQKEEDIGSDLNNGDYDQEESEPKEMKENENQMSMEELLALQEKIGTKAFSKKIMNSKPSSLKKPYNNVTFGRANRNRPSELPLQRKCAPKMNYIDKEKPSGYKDTELRRDPRFDDLSGKLDVIAWKKNYEFLEVRREEELKTLKKTLKKVKNTKKRSQILSTIERIENQDRERNKRNHDRDLKKQEREKAISSMKEGRAPRYTSKKEKYLSMKMEQFDKFESNKKVEKYLKRKEKKRNSQFY